MATFFYLIITINRVKRENSLSQSSEDAEKGKVDPNIPINVCI